jgi:hypothetical protein
VLWEGAGGRREDAIGAFASKMLTESRGMEALSSAACVFMFSLQWR